MNLPAFVVSQSKMFGILCSLSLLLFNNAQANDSTFNKKAKHEIDITLIYDAIKNNLPSLPVIETSNIYLSTDEFIDEFFTFRLSKYEKLEATYENGAYILRYTNDW